MLIASTPPGPTTMYITSYGSKVIPPACTTRQSPGWAVWKCHNTPPSLAVIESMSASSRSGSVKFSELTSASNVAPAPLSQAALGAMPRTTATRPPATASSPTRVVIPSLGSVTRIS